jgi:hypothetical protein
MIKIIQTIVLTAVVFSPLSLISLATSATAHHTSSHLSTVAAKTTQTRKKPVKKGKKPATTGTSQQKTTPDMKTQPSEGMPSSGSAPVKPTNPDLSTDKTKPSGTIAPKPGTSDIPPAGSSLPTNPIPGSSTPTLPTTVPPTK